MTSEDKGVITAEIHLTKNLFKEALRYTQTQSPYDLRRLLSKQWTYRPSIDPTDIIEIVDWEKSEARREGFAVKAIVKVARGRHRLADFLLDHTGCYDVAPHHFIRWTSDCEQGRVECQGCSDGFLFSRQSLEGYIEEEG